MATEQTSLADAWDPRSNENADVYDPERDLLDPPRMYYVASQTGRQDWLDGEHILVSAGVAWRNSGPTFNIQQPDSASEFIDSGGFQATVHFQGEYPYSATELFEWAEQRGADYVAGMDFACEEAEKLADVYDKIDAADLAPIPDRIDATIDQQIEQAQVYEAGDWSFEFVPVVQGYHPDDYRYCARRLREEGIARGYMAIGTVCKRGSVDEIHDVLQACREELPKTEFHLFGATRRVWKDPRFWGKFRSGDTHAWARNTPEGDWTRSEADKRRAFEHFEQDIEETVERIQNQERLDSAEASRNEFAELVYRGAAAQKCVCGNVIPVYGDEFTPTCRHCETTALNRWDRNLAAREQAAHPEATHESTDPTPTDLTDYT